MKKLETKMVGIIIISIMLLTLLIIPTKVLGANEDLQIVQNSNGDYIIYVKDLAKSEFYFAISSNPDENMMDINDEQPTKDEEGNNVILITAQEYEQIKDNTNYLYIRNADQSDYQIKELNFDDAFDKQKMEQVETTTTRIKTELLTDLEERNEEVDGVQYTETVGGLKITDDQNSTYYYQSVKLPAENYSTLQDLANSLNTEYAEKSMYDKIAFAKEFYTLYEQLITQAQWEQVENMEIRQPIEAKQGEQYVVLLRKVAEDGTENYDVKFMTSYREDEEEKIPGSTQTKVVQETAKLPITGDNIILLVILAVIIIIAIIVFIRMKKLQNEKVDK